MARGYTVGIASETKAFKQGIQTGMIDPLEDAQDALVDLGRSRGLDDVARDADKAERALDDLGRSRGLEDVERDAQDAERALDALGRSRGLEDVEQDAKDAERAVDDLGRSTGPDKLERAMEDAQRETEQLKDETKRTADAISDEYRDAYRKAKSASKDFGDEGTGAMGGIKEGAGELSTEISQNLGETVSNFKGDWSDLSQVGQDSLGGLAATLGSTGPAGIAGAAALAAGATGLGLITAEIDKQNQRVKDLKTYFSEAWQEAVEGGRDYIDTATVIAGVNDILFNPDHVGDSKQKIMEMADAIGVDYDTAIRAAAGDTDAMDVVMQKANGTYDETHDKLDKLGEVRTKGASKARTQAEQEANAATTAKNFWQDYYDANAENEKNAQDSARITSDLLLDRIAKTKDVGVEVDNLGNKIVHLPDGDVFIDAETGKASKDVDNFKGDTDGVIDHLNGRKVKLRAENKQAKKEAREMKEYMLDRIRDISHTSATLHLNVDDSAVRNYRPPRVIGESWVNIGGRNATWQ